jgi:diguanylate cyclase (GGDEF)-like protein
MDTSAPPAAPPRGPLAAPERDAAAELVRARRQRVKHLPWMGASCGLDALVLGLFCSVGAAPWWTAWALVGCSMALISISYALLRSGFTERFRDPYISAYQLSITALSMCGTAAIAPAAAFHFYNVLLVVFTFGALRLSARQTLLAGAVLLGAIGSVMLLRGGHSWTPHTPAETAIIWFSYATVLSRCLLVGLYGSALRSRLRRRNEQLATTTARVQELASHDELTGTLNRRAIWSLMEEHAAAAHDAQLPLCVALLDLDHFKSVNDTYGHPAGDEVLRRFSAVLREHLRTGDSLGRYGGEEFLLLLPQVTLDDAATVIDRLRRRVEAAPWHDIVPGRGVTLSAGVAAWQPGERVEDLVARADAALYRAKAQGRNRVSTLLAA